jgi:hypothetical protein
MKFLETIASLSGVWMLIWVAFNYYVLTVPIEYSDSVMWLGCFVVFAGFLTYCFRLLDGRHRLFFRRALGIFLWLCVFLPLTNFLLRFVFAALGIESSTYPGENISDLANASGVAIFCLLMLNWRMFFARSLWRSGIAFGLLMFCVGFLGEYHQTTEAILIRLNQNIGKPSVDIEKIVGKPRAIEGSLYLKGLPNEAATCDKNWLYVFNQEHVLVSFRNDKCVSVQVCDFTHYFKYQNQKVNHAITVAKGKTRETIIKLLGKPTSMDISRIPNWSESDCNIKTREAIFEALRRPRNVQYFREVEMWFYYGTEFGTVSI